MKRILVILVVLSLYSCKTYDHSADRLMFADTEHVVALMEKQTSLLNTLPPMQNVASIYWEMDNGIFELNTLSSNVETKKRDSVLNSWNLSLMDYNFLKDSSKELDSLGICSAFSTTGSIFAFKYRCDITGYDESGRFIFLKEDIKSNTSIDNAFSVILDENDLLQLRMH